MLLWFFFDAYLLPATELCLCVWYITEISGSFLPPQNTFTSSFSVLISSLGSVVGTGNIWRFPRICARHATDGGGLVFLLVWFCFLWLWSIPLVLIEFGVGRFTRKGPVEAFKELIGPAYRFLGAYVAFNNMAIVWVWVISMQSSM